MSKALDEAFWRKWCGVVADEARKTAMPEGPVLVRFNGNRQESLRVTRRLLALEREEPRLLVECYGAGKGEAYRVSWTGRGEMPAKWRDRVEAAIAGAPEPAQGALL